MPSPQTPHQDGPQREGPQREGPQRATREGPPSGAAPSTGKERGSHGLAPYLVDHDAGAAAAIRLLARLPALSGGGHAEAVRAVRQAVIEDRETLRELMHCLGVAPSPVRRLAAVAVGKAATFWLRLQARRRPHLQVLVALDTLEAGIEGKKALWRTLAAAAEVDGRLRQLDDRRHLDSQRLLDYRRLLARAEEQQAALQPLRAEAARGAAAAGG